MAIIVEPVQRYQKVGDKTSPQLYYLKRKANNSRLYNTKRIAQEIEELGGMSAEDVEHVVTALVRNIKRKLTDGDSVNWTASVCSTPLSTAKEPPARKNAP